MNAEARTAFTGMLRRRSYSEGQFIYIQDEAGSEMYCIVSGSVRLSVSRKDGRETVFLLFGPNDCFGVSSLIDGEPRPQTARALTPVELGVLEADEFRRLRAEHPSFSDALLRLAFRQMREVSTHLADAKLSSVDARVAARIIELTPMSSVAGPEHLKVRLPQSEIASMVGASRQSVNKALQSFQRNGWVTLQHTNIIVHDLPALVRISSRS